MPPRCTKLIQSLLPLALIASTAPLSVTSELEHELYRELHRGPQPPLPPPVLPTPETLACYARLAEVAQFAPLPIRTEPAQCATYDLVRLSKIKMPDQSQVALNPPTTIRCGMAEAVAQWVRTDVGPLAAGLGAPLAAVTDLDSYQCRPRNNIAGAKLSEHGKGNAVDIGAIKLRNGGQFTLTDALVSKPFREEMRASACARFTTVLGPGSDAYHNDHIHLDLAERRGGYRICQWNVLEPAPPPAAPAAAAAPVAEVPLPRPRPTALTAAQPRPRWQAIENSQPSFRGAPKARSRNPRPLYFNFN